MFLKVFLSMILVQAARAVRPAAWTTDGERAAANMSLLQRIVMDAGFSNEVWICRQGASAGAWPCAATLWTPAVALASARCLDAIPPALLRVHRFELYGRFTCGDALAMEDASTRTAIMVAKHPEAMVDRTSYDYALVRLSDPYRNVKLIDYKNYPGLERVKPWMENFIENSQLLAEQIKKQNPVFRHVEAPLHLILLLIVAPPASILGMFYYITNGEQEIKDKLLSDDESSEKEDAEKEPDLIADV